MQIPTDNMEIESVYSMIWQQNCRSIALCSANSGDGTSTMSMALAQRNLLAGHSTLIVDLNLAKPNLRSSLNLQKDSPELLNNPQLVHSHGTEISLTGIVAPMDRNDIMKIRRPGVLENCISTWLQQYDTVIIDTSNILRPGSDVIPAERVCAACDASILVVLAGNTRELMISQSVERLERAGAKLLGCIINDKNNPSLKSEMIREIRRLDKYSRRLSQTLQRFINSCAFLSIED